MAESTVVSGTAGEAPATVEAVLSEELVLLHEKNDDLHLKVFDHVASVGEGESSASGSEVIKFRNWILTDLLPDKTASTLFKIEKVGGFVTPLVVLVWMIIPVRVQAFNDPLGDVEVFKLNVILKVKIVKIKYSLP